MRPDDLLARLAAAGVDLKAHGDKLKVTAPKGALTAELRDALRENKPQILARLKERGHAPIPKTWDGGETALSFMQERMWYFSKTGAAPAYNVAAAYRLVGPFDHAAMLRAINHLVARHATLRSFIVEHEGEPRQRFVDRLDVPFPLIDLGNVPLEDRDRTLRGIFEEECRTDFDTSVAPLHYFRVFRFTDDEHVLFCNIHHGLTDAWSFNVILGELCEGYAAFSSGREPDLPDLPVEFPDWIHWQREVRLPAVQDREERYWADKLAKPLPTLELPPDKPRPSVFHMSGGDFPLEIAPELVDRLQERGRHDGATLYMILMAALQLAIHKLTGSDDVVVATPVAGRSLPDLERLIGTFLNTVAIRSRVQPDESLAQFVHDVRENVLGALAHQSVPFDLIVRSLNLPRDPSRTPVYQVSLNLWDIRERPWQWGDLSVEPLRVSTRWTHSEFAVWLKNVEGGGLKGWCTYSSALFDESTAQRLANAFAQILEAYATDADRSIHALSLEDDTDRAVMEQINATSLDLPSVDSVPDFVLRHADAQPDKVAVRGIDQALTYSEVRDGADRVRRALAAAGVGRGDLVAVLVGREVRLVPLLLGILKSGAAFVPVDPTLPAKRAAYLVEDSGARVVVASEEHRAAVGHDVKVVGLDEVFAETEGDSTGDDVGGSDTAYVIYTSGSTGRPKGVQVTHANVLNFLASMLESPGLDPDDVLLSVTTVSFDISILEFFLPLAAGAELVVATDDYIEDPVELVEEWERWSPTVIQATPSFWQMLFDADWQGDPGLRVFCGGEALSNKLAGRLVRAAREVWNLYGPTETTIWSTCHRVSTDDLALPSVPIGRPIGNTTVLVVDEDLRPVPVGTVGELLIGGRGVSPGYWERPDITAERFVEHPRLGRAYRTGDLVRIRPGNVLEFRGRTDHQMKVRGHRIEPGEIEAILLADDAIREAVVGVHEFDDGDARCIAWVARARSDTRTATEIRRALRDFLPEPMIPGIIVDLDALPRHHNGKIDRASLPDPMGTTTAAPEYREPTTEAERFVAESWTRLLQVKQVGKDDNFFELGGHSLLSVRAAAEIERRTGKRFDPRMLFFLTLEQVAATLDLAL